MKKLAFFAAFMAAGISTPALAQEAGEHDNGGFFVGAVTGLDVINLETPSDDEAESGLLYGVTAGYDADMGDVIIGVEAEITDTTISDDAGGAGMSYYGGLRLGLEMDDNDIIYLKGGYNNVDTDLGDNLEGAILGAGFEHNFGTVIARAEYRYSALNFSDVLASNIDGNRHQVAVVIGGKF